MICVWVAQEAGKSINELSRCWRAVLKQPQAVQQVRLQLAESEKCLVQRRFEV